MSLKRFNADVRAARLEIDDPGIPGVISVERGDSEGEAKITFVHERLDGPLSIQLLAQNLNAYPDKNNYLFFTDADDIPPSIPPALEELRESTLSQPLPQCIHNVSDGLIRALSSIDADDDVVMTENEGDFYEYDEDGDWDDLDGDDEIFGLPSTRQVASSSRAAAVPCPDGLRKLKKDLRAAHLAECKVGILDGLNDDSLVHNISISMRASKMALSSETLEVWDIEPSDYIVLLIQIEGCYQSTDWLKSNDHSFQMKFRFGKCSAYKPSVEAANDAFKPGTHPTSTTQDMVTDESKGKPFTKLFISNSLERFMNEDFIKLVKLRLRGSESWDDANLQLQDMAHTRNIVFSSGLVSDISKTKSDGGLPQAHDSDVAKVLPDPFTLPHDRISLPLAAMQFATHYFARCTEYCLRCHRRLPKDFEALKPFVCSNPLCLFQYMTMGLGPSIEHEILTQPYVVDLLVSLCYSSVTLPLLVPSQGYPIREFPTGLRLKAPRLSVGTPYFGAQSSPPPRFNNSGEVIGVPISVEGDLDTHVVTITDHKELRRIYPNTAAVLEQSYLGLSQPSLLHHVVVKYVDSKLNQVEFEFKHRAESLTQVSDAPSPSFNSTMTLIPYDMDFDDLSEMEKARAVSVLLSSLPPIVTLRNHLLDHPNGSLTSHPGVSPSAMTLLQWIVASNRSYILQVSPVKEFQVPGIPDNQLLIRNTKTRPQEQIPGLDSGYVQFRFAQGSPDKELRFHRALSDLVTRQTTSYPTIFAWHGSKLSNWHSILRQGLDYTQIHNGRAYGNGVYFSSQYDTSVHYAQEALCWPNSALQPTKVVSLCEIINSTESFLSTNPFLVVPNVDWIQCRYLIVQRRVLSGKNVDVQKSVGVDKFVQVPQDPQHRAVGPGKKYVEIPVKALPSSRLGLQHINDPELAINPSNESTDTDEEDVGDLEAIISDSESLPSTPKQIQAMSAALVSDSLTDFRPGTLDLSSLPRLALPLWADSKSSKRLAAEIKHLQKIQTTTPLHELGWYVHLDSLENMFQWIVELHSFDADLPLAKDMKMAGVSSVVLEIRFGRDFPFSPPFVRVIRPRFLPFMSGGGGHVTIGGAICMELLTSTGWTPAHSMEGVFMSIKMAMSSLDPKPARLLDNRAKAANSDYTPWEALDAFQRAADRHGWQVPQDMKENAAQAPAVAGAPS